MGGGGDLVTIMYFDPEDGIRDLERHIAGLRDRLGSAFDRHAVRNELHAATFRRMIASRVLLRVSPGGDATAIEVRDWRASDALSDADGPL